MRRSILRFSLRFSLIYSLILLFCMAPPVAAGPPATKTAASMSVWDTTMGAGFKKGAIEAGFSLGAGAGAKIFGSDLRHDLALGYARFGKIVSNVLGQGHWYAGNFALRAELIGGTQFNPNTRYVTGMTLGPRYYFATGSRWVPFIDAGAGAGATDIGNPDLSTTFEFLLQFGGGTLYMLRDDLALNFAAQEFHISNADIDQPNNGSNTIMFLGGLTWFF